MFRIKCPSAKWQICGSLSDSGTLTSLQLEGPAFQFSLREIQLARHTETLQFSTKSDIARDSAAALKLTARIRLLLIGFIIGLVISGATALPLPQEMNWLLQRMGYGPEVSADGHSGLVLWLLMVRGALQDNAVKYPFLAYGTDWLAFGHFVIAVAFYGPYRDPVKNIWVVDFGRIACALVIPYALIFGAIRGIPFGWRLIDCAFGLLGYPVLTLCRRWIDELAASSNN